MKNFYGNDQPFSRESLAAAIQIWNRAAISLVDIRHNLISTHEAISAYRLPVSAFIYTGGGRAEVTLGDVSYQVSRFGVFHGGKGSELRIQPHGNWMEYYIVLYKPGEPSVQKKEYLRLLETVNPFRQQYGFEPDNPVFLSELMRKMYERWKGPTPLNLFYGKIAFYQLVYELYEELDQRRIPVLQPDIAAMVQRYIDRFYAQNISIQDMAQIFNVSYSHLHRIFSRQTGKSPQEYLMETRLCACKVCLEQDGLSMREIAHAIGFSDEYHLNRMFVRHVGMTPGEYRKKMTMHRRDSAIGHLIPFSYNEKSRVRIDELKEKGAGFMFKQMKSKAIIAAALSLMLLLSACSGVPANAGSGNSAPTSAATAQVAKTEVTEAVNEQTRIINTVMGDVEVPMNPKRVVVNGWWVGDVVAFGVTPVAIQGLYASGNGYASKTEGIKRLEKWEAEDIMSETPDLIITGYERNYEDLSKIAPTVFVPYDMPDEERLPLIAQALGKDASEGTALLEAFHQRVEEAKQRLKKAGVLDKTITVCRNGAENGLEIQWSNWWGGSIVYDAFGMAMPDVFEEVKGKNPSMFSDVFSFEVLPQYIGDYVLMNNSGKEASTALEQSPVWNAIPAIKNGNVIEIDAAILFFTDISSQNAQLDLITERLLQLAEKE